MHSRLAPAAGLQDPPWAEVLDFRRSIRGRFRTLVPFAWALLGTATATWVSFSLGLNLASAGFLYLVLVVGAALYAGFWEATAISVLAISCMDYFFIPPLFAFNITNPQNWVALGAFEFTALVISRLSYKARQQAAAAIAERSDSERLYQASRRILLLERSRDPGDVITSVLQDVFSLRGVVLFDSVATRTYVTGDTSTEAEERTRAAFYLNREAFDDDLNGWFCVLRLGTRTVGGLGLLGDSSLSKLLAPALASLSAIALERAHSLEKEYNAEAARQTEELRTAVLDALAHQFKTPLTVIWTASSGLLTLGGLTGTQTELVTLIDGQARKLNGLSLQLLGAGRLYHSEFELRREASLFSELVDAALKNVDQKQERSRFRVAAPDRETAVSADRDLMATALVQLLDNAIKYSTPESPIAVDFLVQPAEVTVSVRSRGLLIPAADRERIFERFYRAAGTQHRPTGTGLGLSIVKKIVNAHQGRVWAESDAVQGTTFFLSLPAAHGDR